MVTTRQRPEAFAWSPTGIDFKGAIVGDYAHYFDPNATNNQSRLEFLTIEDILRKPTEDSSLQHSVPCEYRFNELSWSPLKTDSHPSGLIFGGTENGTVVFFDAQAFVTNKSLSVVSSRRDHQGHVLSVDHSADNRWAISVGGAAQLLLWDLNNLATPFSPGVSNFTDQVKKVRWNRSMDNILVSLSAHRGSLWDMRRPGGPVLEFAEIGSGCDWADICWKPGDSSTMILCNQLAATPGIQKWDLRYPTAPVGEFYIHDRGVTAMDWHQKDPRLVVSAGNDGFIRVFNAETGEVQGAVQLQQQNDKVRRVSWSQARPDLVAIQYYQHPTEFFSIEGGSEESTVGRLDVNVVPTWVSAAPVGASFSAGGRMAAHGKYWDEATKTWRFTVEVKKLPVDEAVYQSAMELQNACDSNTLGSYCEDRAHATEDRNLQTLWTFLAALSNKQGRREFVRILGYGSEDAVSKQSRVSQTSVTSNEVTQLTNIMSSVNCSSPRQNGHDAESVSDDSNAEIFAKQPNLDWNRLDANAWSLLDSLIDQGEEVVIDSLLDKKDYATAFMLARDSSSLTRHVAERYISEELAAPQRLLSLIATDNFDQLLETFPRDQWTRLLALVLMRADRARLVHTMRKIATRWIGEGGPEAVHAALPAVLASDTELLLSANRGYALEERIKQAIVLQKVTGTEVDAEYEKLLHSYCEKLIDGGVTDAAWRLLSNFKTNDERLLTLRHDLFVICGGEERTMSKEPAFPRSKQTQEIANALSPRRTQQRNSVFAPSNAPAASYYASSQQRQSAAMQHPGMPPLPTGPTGPQYSSSSYSGYAPTPPPSVPGMPPLPGYPPTSMQSMYSQAPAVPGFNPVPTPIAPPPVAPVAPMAPAPPMPPAAAPSSYSSYTQYSQSGIPTQTRTMTPLQSYAHHLQERPMSTVSVASSGGNYNDVGNFTPGWNDPPPLPGKKSPNPVANVMEVNWKPLEAAPVTLPNGLPGVPSAAPMRPPSTAPSVHHHEPQHIPQVSLSAEDQAIMNRFYQLIEAVVSVNRTPVALHKAEEARTRLACELAPRLASGRLTMGTRQLLWQTCEQASRGDYRGAVATCGHMVRSGGDFVEVSAFLPALKSLFLLAQSTFSR
ncbi:unnamed protein product [Cylicocyclus nassatus]|uniref:Uncharacterized protein n=1 Tax=Cylicocyclus nassatus TaxID=53992 RepID=A0AA36M6Y8_CYLNA|nr:unnamed protein product [Cylicocyclus nassatus]